MGFFFTLVYIVLVFIRPGERSEVLARLPVMNVAAVLAAGATGLSLLAGRRPTFRSPQLFLFPAFVGWAALSVIAAQRWPGGAVRALHDLTTAGFSFVLITLNVDSLPRLEWTRRVLVLIGLGLVAQGAAALLVHPGTSRYVVAQFVYENQSGWDMALEGPAEEGAEPAEKETVGELPGRAGRLDADEPPTGVVRRIRALGFLNDPNDLAQALAALLPLAALGWRRGRLFANTFFVALPFTVLLAGILLTRSRGGLITLAAMALAAALLLGSRVVSILAALFASLAVVVATAAMGAYVRADASSLGRVDAWSAGLWIVKSSPVWGVGFRGFTDHHEITAHNSFLLCLAELGFVGYFLWLGLLVVTAHDLAVLRRSSGEDDMKSSQELRRWASATALALVGFLAAAFFLSRSYSETLFIVLALPTALAEVARQHGLQVAPLSPLRWTAAIAVLELATLVVIYALVRMVGSPSSL